jgi:two-component system response regulator YesN
MNEKVEALAGRLASLLDVSCRVVDLESGGVLGGVYGDAPDFCAACGHPACNLCHTFSYGCFEAYRWGGKYVYYCHEGLAFVASSVSDEAGHPAGGLVLGPIVMGEMEDTLEGFLGTEKEPRIRALCNLTTRKVGDAAEILADLTEHISGVAHSVMGSVSYKQEDILQSLYEQRPDEREGGEPYPYEAEKRLQQCILSGDKRGATGVLNEVLAKIFVISNYDIEMIRIRMVELLTLLSRATIEAGADSKEIFWFSTGCIKEMNNCKNIYDISAWITGILHRFISYSFDYSSVKHSDTVYKVIEYIRENYPHKITLDSVAAHVSFSKTYLSRIFKEETGENMSMYINRVRIEKAKLLLCDSQVKLIEVANLVGFDDQSYFTKVFKSIVGTSPKRYKEMRKKN